MVLETHVQVSNKTRIRNNINISWCFVDNDSSYSFGRIWEGREPAFVHVSVLHSCAQTTFLDVATGSVNISIIGGVYGVLFWLLLVSIIGLGFY